MKQNCTLTFHSNEKSCYVILLAADTPEKQRIDSETDIEYNKRARNSKMILCEISLDFSPTIVNMKLIFRRLFDY